MEIVLWRTKQGTGHSPCEIPVIAGARSGRYRRRAFFQDTAAQLQRTLRCLYQLPPWRRVPTISRFPDGWFYRRSQIQRRRTWRSRKSTCENQQAGQQNPCYHGNPLRKNHFIRNRLYPESCWQGKNQNPQGGWQYGCQRRNTGTPRPRHFVGQNDWCTIRFHRLRSEHLSQLLRDWRQQTSFPHRQQSPEKIGRQHAGFAEAGTGNQERGNPGSTAFRFPRKDIYRRTYL